MAMVMYETITTAMEGIVRDGEEQAPHSVKVYSTMVCQLGTFHLLYIKGKWVVDTKMHPSKGETLQMFNTAAAEAREMGLYAFVKTLMGALKRTKW
jgi:hypothetical protein